jgi:MOSC domain-containing protein YiiM
LPESYYNIKRIFTLQILVETIYRGSPSYIGEHQQASGINKIKIDGPIKVTCNGIEGDFIGDKVVHGGQEKALHHFPADHYQELSNAFPNLVELLIPGSIGENLSSFGCVEHDICISDIFSIGSVIVQISQPRKPCWKIDEKYSYRGVATLMHKRGLCGWYYRVLEEGVIASNDRIKLVQREKNAPTLKEFLAVTSASRPNPELLEQFSEINGLSGEIIQQLSDRANWLKSYGTKNL